MTVERGEPRDIALARLQLNLSNPRFEDMDGRDEAMIALLQNEQIVELARDIVALGGINPLERLAVFPLEGTGDGEDQQYTTAEGNRRLCALLLIDDPEAVPPDMPNRARYVRTFTDLSHRIAPLLTVPCQVFVDMNETRPWLERLHNGARDGTGRRRWTPEQQARNTSDLTNRAATQLRDLGVELGLVDAQSLSRTTTTQQRFISNSRFRQAMGLVRLDNGRLERTSCWSDFVIMLQQFLSDVANGVVNSRSHNARGDINEYAQRLEQLEGLERRGVPQGPLERRPSEDGDNHVQDTDDSRHGAGSRDSSNDNASGGGGAQSEAGTPSSEPPPSEDQGNPDDNPAPNRNPRSRRNCIGIDDEILASLRRVGVPKLIDLYISFSSVQAPQHALLSMIGCWSFFETLTRAHGRNDGAEFSGYINSIVGRLGVDTQPARNARTLMLAWIANGGNVTKHDWQAAAYDHGQLCNAVDTLKPIIVAIADDIADRQG
ncbi:hypothetical protein [Pleomorphomonas oryzae]|uniref:hypothetical protein n=1 Tax=Pleomorphomonas oryzae TaxID=261934 RepID=UPI0012EB7D53|nr:hypothetical protein [Pleomorphomonas oryzae]